MKKIAIPSAVTIAILFFRDYTYANDENDTSEYTPSNRLDPFARSKNHDFCYLDFK